MSPTGNVTHPDELLRLKKALESNLSDANNLDILAQLTERHVDRAGLAKTKIGVSVSRLRGSSNVQIATRAKRLVESWKRLLAADNSAAKFKTSRGSSAAAASKQVAASDPSSQRQNLTSTTTTASPPSNAPNEVTVSPDSATNPLFDDNEPSTTSNHDSSIVPTDHMDRSRSISRCSSEVLQETTMISPRGNGPGLQYRGSGSPSRTPSVAEATDTNEAAEDVGPESLVSVASKASSGVGSKRQQKETTPDNSLVIQNCTSSSYTERHLSYAGPKTSDSKRDKAREIVFRAFLEGLPEDQTLDDDGVNSAGQLTAAIEDALWERFMTSSPSSFREYQAQLRSIRSNFADKKNPELNIRVFVGAITPTQLAVMASTEMASDVKKKEREKTKQDALEACQSDWDLRNIKRAAGQFPCGKCKSSNTTYFQLQTRSSDEPMTTFVSCLDCGHRWKF